jgi:hypothetical protein
MQGTLKKNVRALVAIAMTLSVAGLTGCGQSDRPPVTKTAAAPVAKADGLPAECEAYIRTVTACVEKVGAANPAIASFKQQMEANRAEWAKVTEKAAFAASCKQMEDSFKATAAPALKC